VNHGPKEEERERDGPAVEKRERRGEIKVFSFYFKFLFKFIFQLFKLQSTEIHAFES
jgi:hypothetical protein